MIYTLKNGELTVKIASRGAELISATNADGREFIWQGAENSWKSHAPILFPVCGRLKGFYYLYDGKRYDMKIHGFINVIEFEAVSVSDDRLVLRVTESEETLAMYPFKFEVIVEYKLEKSKLLSTYTVKNTDSKLLYYAFGLHPGFNLFPDGGAEFEDYTVTLSKEDMLFHPLTGVPDTSPQLDVPYHLDGGVYPVSEDGIRGAGTVILSKMGNTAVLASKKSGHKISIEFSDTLPYLCMWKAEGRHSTFLCLEPWSGTPARGVEVEVLEERERTTRLAPGMSENYYLNINFEF